MSPFFLLAGERTFLAVAGSFIGTGSEKYSESGKYIQIQKVKTSLLILCLAFAPGNSAPEDTLQSESRHDANFVAIDDKVVMMMTQFSVPPYR